MITWGYEFLRCANGFLGRCLNLCLVNPLQGFPLGFLVKGCETSSSVLEHVAGTGAPVELYHAFFPVNRWIMLPQPHIAQNERVFPKVSDFGMKFLSMPKKVNRYINGMCYVSCQVAGAVHVKDAYRIGEGFQRESQPFCDRFVNEGGVSSTVQQCWDDLELLRLGGDSNIQKKLLALIDSLGIDVFRDSVSDRGKQNLFLGFVDEMKHRVRAPAALWSSQRCCLLGT